MIINPFAGTLQSYPGTRLLRDTLRIVGETVHSPVDGTIWTIHSVYAPINKRALGGIRARVLDPSGRVSFVNQRDLEVLLGMGTPGTPCAWAGSFYVKPGDKDWCGLCVDRDDAEDDLLERELFVRACNEGVVPSNHRIHRVVFSEPRTVVQQEYIARAVKDGSTSLEGLDSRWISLR